jgi:cytochrome o ubiquinol oxidase subunit 2
MRALRRVFAGLILIGVVIGTVILLKSGHYDVLQTNGLIAERQRQLLIFTLLLSAIVVVPVFFMLGLFAWKYRAARPPAKKARYTPEWSSNRILETIWWGIPIAIISVLAVVAWLTAHELDPYKSIASSRPPLNVQVVALEWKWLFIYPDLGIATLNQLPVEVNRPIHFSLTADAPMSAFWIPTLGTQIYTMNGMSSQLNLMATNTGDFMGYTTNINGRGYADMKFVTHSMTANDFSTWVQQAQNSTNVMDEAAYVKLTAPTTNDKEKTYRLTDHNLYDNAVMKYMMPTAQKHADDQAPMKMDHSMHSMEGM